MKKKRPNKNPRKAAGGAGGGKKAHGGKKVAGGAGGRSTAGGGSTGGGEKSGGASADGAIYGKNAVLEMLRSGVEVNKLIIQNDSRDHVVQKIIDLAKEKRYEIRFTDKSTFERTHRGLNHQGVLLYTAPYQYAEVEDFFEIAAERGEDPLIVLCDGITDPHNLGAILRTADAAGVHGVIITKRESASINETVVKTSSGAAAHVRVARVTNLVQTIEKLKKMGLWIAGTALGAKSIYETRLDGPLAVVIGSEGSGMGRLVTEKCDILTMIPMHGKGESLNASVAAGVVLYEILRQRKY